jgi:FAD/FMN-containing dehydrogenase
MWPTHWSLPGGTTADGQQITASQTQHPGLFWALHGGGGNFGVATALKYQLCPFLDLQPAVNLVTPMPYTNFQQMIDDPPGMRHYWSADYHNEFDDEANIAWARSFRRDMARHATGGIYLNFIGDEGQDRVRAAYGPANYERLTRIKAEYDPGNVFRGNQNIQPALRSRLQRYPGITGSERVAVAWLSSMSTGTSLVAVGS